MSRQISMAWRRWIIAGGGGLYVVQQRVRHVRSPGDADALRAMRGVDIDGRGRRIAAFGDKVGLVTMTCLPMIGSTMLAPTRRWWAASRRSGGGAASWPGSACRGGWSRPAPSRWSSATAAEVAIIPR